MIPEAADALGGPIEILVNNAAAAIQKPLTGFSVKRRNIMFEANVNAPFDLALAAAPAMVGRWRRVDRQPLERQRQALARSAHAVRAHRSNIAAYGASKAALNRITNGLAMELFGTGVRVNTVEPRAAVLSEGAAELVGDTSPARPDRADGGDGRGHRRTCATARRSSPARSR